MKHLNFDQMINYLENKLDDAIHTKAKTHLADCEVCQSELKIARQTLGITQDTEFVTPQPNLIQRTMAAFRRKKNRVASLPHRTAILDFDNWTKFAPLGVRGATEEHQLLYSVDEGKYDVDLQIFKENMPQSFALRGQILTNNPLSDGLEGIELRLQNTLGSQRYSLTDNLGRFSFTYIPAGTYSLQIIFDDYETLLESVVVKH